MGSPWWAVGGTRWTPHDSRRPACWRCGPVVGCSETTPMGVSPPAVLTHDHHWGTGARLPTVDLRPPAAAGLALHRHRRPRVQPVLRVCRCGRDMGTVHGLQGTVRADGAPTMTGSAT